MFESLWPLCRVPRDLNEVLSIRAGAECDPSQVGIDPLAPDWIWQAAEQLYASGAHPAVSLCVRRRGRVLLDRTLGHAAGNAPGDPPGGPLIPATVETPICLFSASKPVTAIVLHLLEEQGRLHADDPVAEYIPEFARHGKHTITIRHMLNHRAGVPNPAPGTLDDLDVLRDPRTIIEVLCDLEPLWRPGHRLAYHAVTAGFLLAEIVRRVTGDDIRTVLAREILDPLGFRWMNFGVAPPDLALVAENAVTGPAALPPASTLVRRALGLDLETVTRFSNDPRFLCSIFPSANVIATADEACAFFEMLRRHGELDGTRVLDRRTVMRAIGEQGGFEPDLTLILPFRYSMGFMLGAEWFSLYGPHTTEAFGHLGLSNIIVWADPARDVSGALLTSGKPLVYPEIFYLWETMRRIGTACPRDGQAA